MGGKHCRLYDENLVHNIMISTGLSILEFLRDNKNADSDEICEFVDINARNIIDDTIEQLNSAESDPSSNDGEQPDQWAPDGDEELL